MATNVGRMHYAVGQGTIMARPTTLDRLCRCDHEARVGVYFAYYSVKSKHKSAVSKQVKGSLPARGYCVDCFLEFAKRKGLPGDERQELREKLEGRSVSPRRRKY